MSFAPQVRTDDTATFTGNAMRFATQAEAERSASDLAARWFLVREWRVVESKDPVNYTYGPAGELHSVPVLVGADGC